MFLAGTDTTYTAIEWVVAELIKNPDVMKRVQEEVRGITLCRGEITEESIDRMKYLKAVIKETLRLHPPGPLLLPRETMEEVELQGYHIPAGTRVIVNAWAIGRDPRSWDKPEEFYPERFVNCDIDFKGQDFKLIPFGTGRRGCPGIEFAMATIEITLAHLSGRRGCPGIEFAMATIEITLAHLLGHFDWELADEMQGEVLDMSESPGLTAHWELADEMQGEVLDMSESPGLTAPKRSSLVLVAKLPIT
ncbi:uncharacterized protein A4U43_C01F30700 [Asparagus officinalis]|uniref:Uncharacterized protein n=1 Tax=Asparagus officinalis TaxID=4686 RepID=A0A5P1FUC7_ASPOF|nr:uncharacterized protein A4U43_C01F30700 [Asparagus officinalis]